MRRTRLNFNYVILFMLAGIFVLVIIEQCFAQSDVGSRVHMPEPGSLALISTTGFFGWLVRFARRRFEEFKRFSDVVVSATGLVLTAPIIAVTAIMIKVVSPGPVFFRQERVGLGGRIFKMYKLRTMRIDAEKFTGPVWAKENDARVIRFCGRLLRKTHIDELPQLFNVLKGNMSIIGPRPERPVFVKELSKEIADYRKRLEVRPGITGLAQVWHKYDETLQDVKKKLKLDLLYIRRMCLAVDMRILALTIVAVVTGRGAR